MTTIAITTILPSLEIFEVHDLLGRAELVLRYGESLTKGMAGLKTDARPDLTALQDELREDIETLKEREMWLLQQPITSPWGDLYRGRLYDVTEKTSGKARVLRGVVIKYSASRIPWGDTSPFGPSPRITFQYPSKVSRDLRPREISNVVEHV